MQGPPGPFEIVDPPEDYYIKGDKVEKIVLYPWRNSFYSVLLSALFSLDDCVFLQGKRGVKGECGPRGLDVS